MPAKTKASPRKAQDPTRQFFDELVNRGDEPLLSSAAGTIRFDLMDGKTVEHWFVTLTKGNLSVSHADGPADATVRLDKALFDRMVQGKTNAMAATLRGVLEPHGNLGLIILFQRIFPGPPRSRARPRPAEAERGTS